MIAYYQIIFWVSVVLFMIYLLRYSKTLVSSYGFAFLLITASEFGALVRSQAQTLETALIGNIISYIGGCFLPVVVTFCVLALCRINLRKRWKCIMVLLSSLMYALIILDDKLHLLYKNVSLSSWRGITLIDKEYGILHTIFYVMVIFYFILNIGILFYGFLKKRNASVQNIALFAIMEFFSLFVYFVQKFFPDGIQLTAFTYIISMIILLVLMDRFTLYDVDGTVVHALLKNGDLGCFLFTKSRKYLGSNSVAEEWFPQMLQIRVDGSLPEEGEEIFRKINHWMDCVEETKENQEFYHKVEDRIYRINGGYLTNGHRVVGYRFTVRDYTEDQKYLDLLNRYNSELEGEVEEKTKHIREMQDRLVLGMADMVESRDNSTGGHIKRTSVIVRILVSEMQKDPEFKMDDVFCAAVVKAAPMHDLGKIAVDDVILRKPGKFLPEEFAIMKTHAEKGAVIVRKLLSNLNEDYFAKIAENVAHFHHERVDGTGYPCGLKGDDIPLEARIMAIADVYDALVSKRCYKESMDFEQAYNIIEEGMGTQFDASLEKYFVTCREKLEAFYKEELSK